MSTIFSQSQYSLAVGAIGDECLKQNFSITSMTQVMDRNPLPPVRAKIKMALVGCGRYTELDDECHKHNFPIQPMTRVINQNFLIAVKVTKIVCVLVWL